MENLIIINLAIFNVRYRDPSKKPAKGRMEAISSPLHSLIMGTECGSETNSKRLATFQPNDIDESLWNSTRTSTEEERLKSGKINVVADFLKSKVVCESSKSEKRSKEKETLGKKRNRNIENGYEEKHYFSIKNEGNVNDDKYNPDCETNSADELNIHGGNDQYTKKKKQKMKLRKQP